MIGDPTTGTRPVTNGRCCVSAKKPVWPFITVTLGDALPNVVVLPWPAVIFKKPLTPLPRKPTPKLAPALGSNPPNGGTTPAPGPGPPKLKNQLRPESPQRTPTCS